MSRRPLSDSAPAALIDHVGYLAVNFGYRAQRLFEEAIAPLGLRPPLYDVLTVIDDQGPVSQRAIAAALGIDPARVVAHADELERAGFVVRTVDPDDRRRNLLTFTPAGRKVTSTAMQRALEVQTELLSRLSPRDQATLRRLLRAASAD